MNRSTAGTMEATRDPREAKSRGIFSSTEVPRHKIRTSTSTTSIQVREMEKLYSISMVEGGLKMATALVNDTAPDARDQRQTKYSPRKTPLPAAIT